MSRLLFALVFAPLAATAAEPAAVASAPAAASATAASATAVTGGSGVAAQLGQLTLGLLLVVGVIFLLAWLLRRVQQMGPRGSDRAIRLIASQALSPRDRLVLVQVGNEQVLLGLTPGRITPLHVLKEPVHLPDSQPAQPEFAQRLMELLGKDKDKH